MFVHVFFNVPVAFPPFGNIYFGTPTTTTTTSNSDNRPLLLPPPALPPSCSLSSSMPPTCLVSEGERDTKCNLWSDSY